MKLNLITCINKINALGKGNELLYHIPSDLANFKRMTVDNVIIMGKNTYESLPKKPLPNRTTLIICNETEYKPEVAENETVFVCDSIENALATLETFSEEKNVFVVGGASIYQQFMERGLIDKMFITLVNDEAEGDVFFPTISADEWKERYHSDKMQCKDYSYEFIIFEKIKTNA